MKLFSTENNYLKWGLFCYVLFCFGLFLIVLHLGFKELLAPAAERRWALLAVALHPTLQLSVFPPAMICFMKVPAEVNTSLTNFTSSLRKYVFVVL